MEATQCSVGITEVATRGEMAVMVPHLWHQTVCECCFKLPVLDANLA